MNILGLVFPASFFQQSNQQQTLQSNNLMDKCSSVSYTSGTLKNRTTESPQGVKSHENTMYHGSGREKSDDPDVFPMHSSVANKSFGLVLNSPTLNEHVKRTTKKKKKKKQKGKSNKMSLDNDVQETAVDLTSLSCPSTQSPSKEISCMTELTESDNKGALFSCQSSKEVIDNSVLDKIDAKCNSRCLQSTLISEGSMQLFNSGEIGSLSRISKVSSEIDVLQHKNIGHNKVGEVRKKQLANKQGKSTNTTPRIAAVRPVPVSEPIIAYLQNSKDCKTKLCTKTSHHDKSELKRSHGSIKISEKSSNAINYGAERSNTSLDKVIADNDDCMTKLKVKAAHTSRSIYCVGQGTIDSRMVMGVKEVSRNGNENCPSNQHSLASDPSAVALSQDVKHDKCHSQTLVDTSRMPSCITNHKQIGKENAHFVWQKTGKNIGRKRSNHDLWHMDAYSPGTISQLQQKFAADELLQPPQLPYTGRNGLWQRVENFDISDHEMLRTHKSLGDAPPEWVAQHRSNANLGQYGSRSREDDVSRNTTYGRSKDKLNQSFKKENANNYKREFWISKADLSKSQCRSILTHEEALEVPRTRYIHRRNIAGQRSSHGNHHHKSDCPESHVSECVPSFPASSSYAEPYDSWTRRSGHHKPWYEIQPRAGTMIPKVGDITGESSQAILAEEDMVSACFEIELPSDRNAKECTMPRVSLQRWIPIGKKDFSVVKTNQDDDAGTMRRVHQDTDNVAVSEAAWFTDISNGMKVSDKPSDSRKMNYLDESGKMHSASDYKSNKLSIYIGSEMAGQALHAAYSLQIASDRIQLATGSPIAEFEKLLYSASPVIIPSFVQQHCKDFIKYQPNVNSFIKLHNSDVLLRDIWEWYESLGNYGLEVKAEDSQNSEGLGTDVSFSAHFVPFLSAVQLFGASSHSFLSSNTVNLSTDMPERREMERCLFSSLSRPGFVAETVVSNQNSAKKHMRQFNLASSDENGYSNLVSAFCSYDSEVIFEYFEHEPPQQRKPLYEKVKDLVEVGTSNSKVFGDPSNLDCINLQDLHPASWYSVAWYPIYRIPEGSFRASFLTYHSLGHLVLRHLKSADSTKKNAFSVVSPVLGMQSYNAQGECWFYPKKLAENHLKRNMTFDSSGILKERLRTLEENAALFARGEVSKGHTKAVNRHPDYEFFLSRKH